MVGEMGLLGSSWIERHLVSGGRDGSDWEHLVRVPSSGGGEGSDWEQPLRAPPGC